jgi:hypothetical protein
MLGVAPKADGTFAVLLRPQWMGKRYRATVAGPAYAPDAQAVVARPRHGVSRRLDDLSALWR